MAGSVARLHGDSPNGNGRIPPADIYKAALDEYRFQAQFNWSRTQYLLALNVAILAASVALSSRPGHGAALVYALGVVASVLTVFVVRAQHDYYRAARDRMVKIEQDLDVLPEHRVNSTSSLGHRKRWVSVNQVVYMLLGSLAVANLVGLVVIVVR